MNISGNTCTGNEELILFRLNQPTSQLSSAFWDFIINHPSSIIFNPCHPRFPSPSEFTSSTSTPQGGLHTLHPLLGLWFFLLKPGANTADQVMDLSILGVSYVEYLILRYLKRMGLYIQLITLRKIMENHSNGKILH